MHDYSLMEPPPAEPVRPCPCCGAQARVWQYAENPSTPVTRVVMCDTQNDVGPRDSGVNSGCLLSMPPDDFYRARGADAVRYWNEFAEALCALQRANRWETHRALRGDASEAKGEARTDTQRLDFIAQHARSDPKMDGQHVWWPTSFENSLRGPTLRAAIDNAMGDAPEAKGGGR